MKVPSNVVFRKGNERDIEFLVDGIILAEKSGSEILSYSTIFELPETEIKSLLMEILSEDVTGQELCFSDYTVAEVDGKQAGALCSWVEGEGGQSSTILKGTLIQHFFPSGSVQNAFRKKNLLDQVTIHRTKNLLMLENGWVAEGFRGAGVFKAMFIEKFRMFRELYPHIKICQAQFMKSNPVGIPFYLNLGFRLVQEKTCNDPEILKLIPSNTRVMMELDL